MVTEITNDSWFSRIGQSIKSFVVGLALFIGAFPLLWMNEGRAVRTEKGLHEGQRAVVEATAATVDPSKNGKLVHVTGKATTTAQLADPDFNVSMNAIKLRRHVEMYQWVENKKSETRKKVGGGSQTVTTYTYSKKWAEDAVNSTNFHEPAGHRNPEKKPFESRDSQAQQVSLGAYSLSPTLVAKMDDYEPLPVSQDDLGKVPAEYRSYFKVNDGSFYLGDDPQNPVVGDVRITFSVVKPGDVSVIAQQSGTTFAPWHTSTGTDVELLKRGTVTAEAMFQSALEENTVMTWFFRIAGFFAMFFGLRFVFKPLSVLGDIIPLFGTLLAFGTGLFAFVMSAVLSVVTIAMAWIFYRPFLGIFLLAVAIGVLVFFAMRGKKKTTAVGAPQPVAAVS